jgi:hypothetical protein
LREVALSLQRADQRRRVLLLLLGLVLGRAHGYFSVSIRMILRVVVRL